MAHLLGILIAKLMAVKKYVVKIPMVPVSWEYMLNKTLLATQHDME
jgi:hypothetical protein